MKKLALLASCALLLASGCNAPTSETSTYSSSTSDPIAQQAQPAPPMYLTNYINPAGFSFTVPQGSFVTHSFSHRGYIQNFIHKPGQKNLEHGQFQLEYRIEEGTDRKIKNITDCKTNLNGKELFYTTGTIGWIEQSTSSPNSLETISKLCTISNDQTILVQTTTLSEEGPNIANTIFQSFKPKPEIEANKNAFFSTSTAK